MINIIISEYKKYKIAIWTGIIFAFMAYMYMFTNKIPNGDEVRFLFSKGATSDLGRWGLDILSLILPNVSMPWLWGVLSTLALTLSAYVVIKMFNIENKFMQVAISAVIVTFPANICIFTYMFTSVAYVIAGLFATISAYFISRNKGIKNYAVGCVFAVFCIGIYQAYITTISSLLVVTLILDLLNDSSYKDVFVKAIKYVATLAVAIAIYFAVSKLALFVLQIEYIEHAQDSMSFDINFINNLILTGKIFIFQLIKISSLSTNQLARFCHIMLVVLIMILLWNNARKKHLKPLKWLAVAFMIFILIMSVSAFQFMLGQFQIMMYFSFISFYVLAVSLACALENHKQLFVKISSTMLVLLAVSNVYTANSLYTIMGMEYENSYAYFSKVVAQVQLTPEYKQDTKVYFVGGIETKNAVSEHMPPLCNYCSADMMRMVTRRQFVENYIDNNINIAKDYETKEFLQTHNIDDMPIYPDYGSIRMIDDAVVVRFGEKDFYDPYPYKE